MASLASFARRIRKLAGRIEENVENVVSETAIAVSQTVILATPVDTGRARANWQLEIGAPARTQLDRVDPSGQQTMAENNTRARTRKLGQDIFISNNLDYITPLNEGTSSQAPAGFVEMAVEKASTVVAKARVTK